MSNLERPRWKEPTLRLTTTFAGHGIIIACDRRCDKTWGRNNRPKVVLSNDEDDYAYLADSELGKAPVDPGTYEGGQGKPKEVKDADDMNRWCARECERARMFVPGTDQLERIDDFSRRVYNQNAKQGRNVYLYDPDAPR